MKKLLLLMVFILNQLACAPRGEVQTIYPPKIEIKTSHNFQEKPGILNKNSILNESFRVVVYEQDSEKIDLDMRKLTISTICESDELKIQKMTNEPIAFIDLVPAKTWISQRELSICNVKLDIEVENHSTQTKHLSFQIDNLELSKSSISPTASAKEAKPDFWSIAMGSSQLANYLKIKLPKLSDTKFYRIVCRDTSMDFPILQTTSVEGIRQDIINFMNPFPVNFEPIHCRIIALGLSPEISPILRLFPEPDLSFSIAKKNSNLDSPEAYLIVTNNAMHSFEFSLEAKVKQILDFHRRDGKPNILKVSDLDLFENQTVRRLNGNPIFEISPGEQIMIPFQFKPNFVKDARGSGISELMVGSYKASLSFKGQVLVSYDDDVNFEKAEKIPLLLKADSKTNSLTIEVKANINVCLYQC